MPDLKNRVVRTEEEFFNLIGDGGLIEGVEFVELDIEDPISIDVLFSKCWFVNCRIVFDGRKTSGIFESAIMGSSIEKIEKLWKVDITGASNVSADIAMRVWSDGGWFQAENFYSDSPEEKVREFEEFYHQMLER